MCGRLGEADAVGAEDFVCVFGVAFNLPSGPEIEGGGLEGFVCLTASDLVSSQAGSGGDAEGGDGFSGSHVVREAINLAPPHLP